MASPSDPIQSMDPVSAFAVAQKVIPEMLRLAGEGWTLSYLAIGKIIILPSDVVYKFAEGRG